jgi:hypothetical protein
MIRPIALENWISITFERVTTQGELVCVVARHLLLDFVFDTLSSMPPSIRRVKTMKCDAHQDSLGDPYP